MSMFLGPIHHLMFEKIKIASQRSRSVVEKFSEKFGEEVGNTINTVMPAGLVDFGNTPLEELLGDNPIHQFLQSLIDEVEIAEAKLVTAFLYGFPDGGKELLLESFKSDGARVAKDKVGDSSADINSICNSINQFYLEGMPCDPGGSFNVDGNSVEVSHSECLHKAKWDSAGAPADIMCELLDAWVAGFAQQLNPDVKLERVSTEAKGDSSCLCKLSV